jgi:hypothetical protein
LAFIDRKTLKIKKTINIFTLLKQIENMETKKNEFLIDIFIDKYQDLSRNKKSYINFTVGILLVLFATGAIYNGGKAFGEFLFYVNN